MDDGVYRSFLLRIWSATEGDAVVWRASLEVPQTDERLGFASLERLFDFLRDQTDLWESGQRRDRDDLVDFANG